MSTTAISLIRFSFRLTFMLNGQTTDWTFRWDVKIALPFSEIVLDFRMRFLNSLTVPDLLTWIKCSHLKRN